MEHGNSKPGKPGEEAVIQAYRDADAFQPSISMTRSQNYALLVLAVVGIFFLTCSSFAGGEPTAPQSNHPGWDLAPQTY